MAELEKLASDLLSQPWISVCIGDSRFLLKASFSDTAYKLMLSDLDSVWWEEMNSDGLKQRAQELNKRLKASVSAFCRNLREAVGPLMRDGSGDHLSGFECERARNLLRISLRSELSGVPFYWIFHCTEAPLSMVSRHMICPLLNMMRALHRQTQDLMLLLERKDAEILDYKENGATLSRDRLETKTFNQEEFKDRFLAECSSLKGHLTGELWCGTGVTCKPRPGKDGAFRSLNKDRKTCISTAPFATFQSNVYPL
ncbi:non-homologous end-joining factor 1 isoform X2 [Scyliorhinus canicula]|uniref:non-homologous end-joining factor 1 isoform X2 n=1 Tax=Scyliorhinus canicula TaxID=7830 RepID=UPI0018F41831|nr:non-homologous end-joining factor 1 isoform X2 [Scyliorhinus canicula]